MPAYLQRLNLFGAVTLLCLACSGCSPRDFLTRRLAAALIAGSENFKSTDHFLLRTGPISGKDYGSPEYLVLQQRGWINGTVVRCAPNVTPPPCWDVALTPIGVETFRDLIRSSDTGKQYFSVPTVRRELVAVTGISKGGNFADVDFTWRWIPLNEVGAALYAGDAHYKSTVGFRHYDDGWRLVDGNSAKSSQTLDEALKNSAPVP